MHGASPQLQAFSSPDGERLRRVELGSEVDLDGFRSACRSLIAARVPPERCDWQVAGQGSAGLFDSAAPVNPGRAHAGEPTVARPSAVVSVPATFLELCESVILHADPARFGLLYKLLWRLVHEPAFRHDTLDPDMTRARLMAQQVRRDMHKMTAFVRFREVPAPAGDESPEAAAVASMSGSSSLHVAWFEPEHHIVQAIAPFFIRRFTNMKWAILTPQCSLRWDGEHLLIGPGASRDDAPGPDAQDDLWLTYYQHIFNPARLKVDAMQKEMPRKYWRNLPEAKLIAPLVAKAAARSDAMVEQAATSTTRRLPPREIPARHEAGDVETRFDRDDKRGSAFGEYGSGRDSVRASQELGPHEGRHDSEHETSQASHQTSQRANHPSGQHANQQESDNMTTDEQPGADSGGRAASGLEAAASPPTLENLRRAASRCRECPLGEPATQTVWGDGKAGARVMVVGEQPGDQEDLQGKPFVGPAGKLFDRAVAELGWSRRELYVTNAVKHFKYEVRGRRRIHKTPGQREAAACLHWLESEIEAVGPQALIALGATAARSLMGRPVAVMSERGQWLTRADGRRVLITLHPSALLRAPDEERDAAYARWIEDLRLAADLVTGAPGAHR